MSATELTRVDEPLAALRRRRRRAGIQRCVGSPATAVERTRDGGPVLKRDRIGPSHRLLFFSRSNSMVYFPGSSTTADFSRRVSVQK